MKRLLSIAAIIATLTACNNPNPGESGTVNDGIKTVDSNGAFEESSPTIQNNPSTDTAMGENRVDIQQRDSAKKQ
jgi:hypothetical protein